MVIGVTIKASLVFERISEIYLVTRFAAYSRVSSREGETGFGVVESADPFDRLEGGFRMALRTVRSELVLMRILVTVYTT